MNKELSQFEEKFPVHDALGIDAFLQWIISRIELASRALKHTKFSKGLNPYWCETLQNLHRAAKSAWHDWNDAAKPKVGDLYVRYKSAKKVFAKELKHARERYEQEQMEMINSCHEMDQKHFWKLVNRSKQGNKSVHPIQIGDNLITDPDEVRSKWKNYFESLYTPRDV